LFRPRDAREALAVPPRHFQRKHAQVRHCFDSLLYYFDRYEQLIKSGALRFRDIDTPWNWYAKQMAKEKTLYWNYAIYIDYARAIKFLERYRAWRAAG